MRPTRLFLTFITISTTLFFTPKVSAQNENYLRIARIVVDSAQLESYKAALKEGMEAAVRLEAGVLNLSAVYEKAHPTHITVFETYADMAAYKLHIQTPHFNKYKTAVAGMVKSLELIDVAPIALAVKNRNMNVEQIIFDRIDYVFNLKSIIDQQVWRGFNDAQFDVPLVYYTDSSSYIANPTPKFLKTFKPIYVFGNKNIKVYKTINRLDSVLFHMETGMSSGDDAKNSYNYNAPFMNCSSFEITATRVPDTRSTEYWTTMVMHEYFHGFQFKHKTFSDYVIKNIAHISEDSLKNIYVKEGWFKQKVDIENGFLLKAIESTNPLEINKNIDTFFIKRKERRLETKQKLNLDIENYEKTYETMEGTARYVEYSLQVLFANLPTGNKLMQSDPNFQDYKQFKNYKMENDPWLYTTGKSYFYATGFNIVRLLDKLQIEYKTKLFNKGEISLEQLLLTRNK